MSTEIVSLADAKAHLSELTEKVARGETIVITKRGKPVAQVSQPSAPREPVPLEQLRELTDGMTPQSQEAGNFMRQVRDEARY